MLFGLEALEGFIFLSNFSMPKSHVRKAEWNYINDTIMEGLQNNNSKPFWKYKKNGKCSTVCDYHIMVRYPWGVV
jgi:hypothetical protein